MMSASAMLMVSSTSAMKSRILARLVSNDLSASSLSSFPPSPFPAAGGFITRGRTVDICGRCLGHRMVAMMLPPKAGRVCSSSPSSLMSSPVQSAVSPVWISTATRERKLRPAQVAPASMISGFFFLMRSAQTLP
jgi:hypothetical protein